MKFSEYWLREWVNPSINIRELVNQITMIGLKVNKLEPVSEYFEGVVVGNITKCTLHPYVKKLWLIKVDVGTSCLLNIACDSINNCYINLKVVVALPGATLPGNIRITPKKLYGEVSEGILCALSTLGISTNYCNEIIKLPHDAPVGENIRNYLDLNDTIIDVSITPNRIDCCSIFGLAHDIAAINRISVKELKIESIIPLVNRVIPISIENTNACPSYLGRIIENIDMSVSTPIWMREKLRRCGIQPTNILLDIINYVILELGCPINFLNVSNISGDICVRFAKSGENFVFSDNNIIEIQTDTLVIADNDKLLSIAGISEGIYSIINSKIVDIFLGCAFFNPAYMLGKSDRYGLCNTHTCYHEYGINVSLLKSALERTTFYISKFCGGLPGPIFDKTDKTQLPKPYEILLNRSKLNNLIGFFIPDCKIVNILTSLGCKLKNLGTAWYVLVPNKRFDIKIEEDLIEEIIRIYGYNFIPRTTINNTTKISSYNDKDIISISRIKTFLVDSGYQEVITYSFVDPKLQVLLHPKQIPIFLLKPISKEMSAMRLSLWTGLIKTVLYNQRRQHKRIRLFENGFCFVPDENSEFKIRQDFIISGIVTGTRYDEHWDIKSCLVDFYDVKGNIEDLLDIVGKLDRVEFVSFVNPALHPGQSASIYFNKEYIGCIGVLHPFLEKKLNLQSSVIIFDLIWNKISENQISKINLISQLPINRRDISIIVSTSISADDIINVCKTIDTNKIVNVKLFDVYQGYGIKDGFKSLAISLFLRDNDNTLREEEMTEIVEKCLFTLKKMFRISIRH